MFFLGERNRIVAQTLPCFDDQSTELRSGWGKEAALWFVCCSFVAAVPRVLAEVYHSLGSQLPEALLAQLPADFFSDESLSKDSVSPPAPSASIGSLASAAGRQLQTLRDGSANQRRRCDETPPPSEEAAGADWLSLFLPVRSGALTRHRSLTESSQSLRQIEIPKRTTRAVRASPAKPAAACSPGVCSGLLTGGPCGVFAAGQSGGAFCCGGSRFRGHERSNPR